MQSIQPDAGNRHPRMAWINRVDQGRHPPRAGHAVPTDRGNLSEVGRCGWAGPLAPWMAPSSPQGRVYGVSCQPTPLRHPTEHQLLLLLRLLPLRLPASGRHYCFGRCRAQPCRTPLPPRSAARGHQCEGIHRQLLGMVQPRADFQIIHFVVEPE